MNAVVIDTNVLLVANGSHTDISLPCQQACVERLLARQREGVVVLDDGYRILSEYGHKTRPNQPKGVGDVFLKWLLQNVANSQRVHLVPLTERGADEFDEFPDSALQPEFDAPDRKFAAVAYAHPDKPEIWQAADSKWLNWWRQLRAKGVRVEFVCPSDATRFYEKKFPGKAVPPFPNKK